MLVSLHSTLEFFKIKNSFLSNNYLLQFINSVLPFIVSNLSNSLAMLRQIDTNQSLTTGLQFLDENPVPTRRYLKMLLFALLSVMTIVVAYFGSDFIRSSSAFSLVGLVAATIVSVIIFASHFLERSTLLAPAVKKRVNGAMEAIGSMEKQAECAALGLLVQLRPEERQYLERQFAQLTSEHALMLFGVIPEEGDVLQEVLPVSAGANSWNFFKHHSVYVKERSFENIHKEYSD